MISEAVEECTGAHTSACQRPRAITRRSAHKMCLQWASWGCAGFAISWRGKERWELVCVGLLCASGTMYFPVPVACVRGVRALGHTLQEEGQRAEEGEIGGWGGGEIRGS